MVKLHPKEVTVIPPLVFGFFFSVAYDRSNSNVYAVRDTILYRRNIGCHVLFLLSVHLKKTLSIVLDVASSLSCLFLAIK